MTNSIKEIQVKSMDNDETIFHWTKESGVILDIRTESDIALKRKLKEFNLSSYKELVTAREMLKVKKNVLNEELTPLQESIFEKVTITEEDEEEAKNYSDFKDYQKKKFNIILSENSL